MAYGLTLKLNTPFVYSVRGKYIRPIAEDREGWYFRLKDGLYVVFYENAQQLIYDLRKFKWTCGTDDIVYDETLKLYVVKVEVNRFGIYVHKMMRVYDFLRKIDESVNDIAKQG